MIFFRLSLSFKRQKSEKILVNPCVQNKSQTVGVRVVKTENQTRADLLTEILRCFMKFKINELGYDLESNMNHKRTSTTLKSIIQSVKWKKNSETFALHIHKHQLKFIAQMCDIGLGSHQANA